MDKQLEFERMQLEHLIGKGGWSIIEGQRNGHQIIFKIKKVCAEVKL